MTPKVEVITLLYNSSRFVTKYLDAFGRLDFPANSLRITLLDNSSPDASLERAKKYLEERSGYPYPVRLLHSDRNTGFAGGNNLVIREFINRVPTAEPAPDYFLILNPDTAIAPDCLRHLVNVAESNSRIGMVEARQTPREHPKWYDSETFDTGWCSGGGVLIRRAALETTGLFDHHFFLYAEDVDLSWRMWLHGWECKFAPQATYEHITEELDPEREHGNRQYFNFRNGFFMHYKYDSLRGIYRHYRFVAQTIANCQDPITRARLRKARFDAHKKLPHMFLARLKLWRRLPSRWVVFNGFDYEVRRPFRDRVDGGRDFFATWDQAAAINQ